MWVDQKNSVSDEMQDSDQRLQISFRVRWNGYLISIPRLSEFSQSLLGVPTGGDIVWQKTKYQASTDKLRIRKIMNYLWISHLFDDITILRH